VARRAPVTDGLADRLRHHLDRAARTGPALLEPADPVVVALSGGLDSVVLLHLLRFPLRDRIGPIAAAHLDHAMRPESDRDALWVTGLCRAWGVDLVQDRAVPPPRSEADARRARYAFLERAAPADALIATAHHADDQAETVLFRLARGTGLRGLRGIAPRRGRIVRPLLPFTRADLASYAADAGLAVRADPTNLELRYARNRIRHQVLPALERARPGAARALASVAAEAARAERAWEQVLDTLADDVVIEEDGRGRLLARNRFQAYHPQLRARLLRHLLRRFGTAPGRAGTKAALEFINSGSSGGSVDLAAGIRLERDFDRIRIIAGHDAAAGAPGLDEPLEITGPAAGTGRAVVGGRAFQVEWGAASGTVARDGVVLPDPRLPLVIRGWRPGDRIRFGYGTKKLKKLLAEARLDRRARARVPVLVDGTGTVLWVVGLARAEGVGVGGEEVGDGFQIAVRDAGYL
jgi:tRNA(Ile)-lysidine synthase